MNEKIREHRDDDSTAEDLSDDVTIYDSSDSESEEAETDSSSEEKDGDCSTLVVDLGSYKIKGGFAGDDAPRAVFRLVQSLFLCLIQIVFYKPVVNIYSYLLFLHHDQPIKVLQFCTRTIF